MTGAWCRFCGAFGLPDRMVCSGKECMAKDLAEDLSPFEFNPDFSGSLTRSGHSGPATGYSLHTHAIAIDMTARTENRSFTNLNIT